MVSARWRGLERAASIVERSSFLVECLEEKIDQTSRSMSTSATRK
jgi:hypothetical protein